MDINKLLSQGLQRNEIFDMIPGASSKILDIGYGDGTLLMRLKHQKICTELYGIEKTIVEGLTEHLDGNWDIDITSPGKEFDTKYANYFNYVILHDVLEHIYNPWAFLQAIHKFLATEGKCFIVTPNAQFWELPYALLSGVFPYGAHGYWNEDHIRWFTLKSLIETSVLSGYTVKNTYLMYPESLKPFLNVFKKIMSCDDLDGFDLPPMGWRATHLETGFPVASPTFLSNDSLKVLFPGDVKAVYPYLLAVKLIIVCTKAEPTEPVVIYPGSLKKYRELFQANHSPEDIANLVTRSVEVLLERR